MTTKKGKDAESKAIGRLFKESSDEEDITAMAYFEGEVRMTKVIRESDGWEGIESADDLIGRARNEPTCLLHAGQWYCLLPWLKSPGPAVRRFWRVFNDEKTENARRVSLLGPKTVNRQIESSLITAVSEYISRKDKLMGGDNDLDIFPYDPPEVMMSVFRDEILDWIFNAVTKDHGALIRLHELLSESKAAKSEYEGQPTLNSKIFSAFIQHVVNHLELPTKGTVRKNCRLEGPSGSRQAARAFADLGLAGLPEG